MHAQGGRARDADQPGDIRPDRRGAPLIIVYRRPSNGRRPTLAHPDVHHAADHRRDSGSSCGVADSDRVRSLRRRAGLAGIDQPGFAALLISCAPASLRQDLRRLPELERATRLCRCCAAREGADRRQCCSAFSGAATGRIPIRRGSTGRTPTDIAPLLQIDDGRVLNQTCGVGAGCGSSARRFWSTTPPDCMGIDMRLFVRRLSVRHGAPRPAAAVDGSAGELRGWTQPVRGWAVRRSRRPRRNRPARSPPVRLLHRHRRRTGARNGIDDRSRR